MRWREIVELLEHGTAGSTSTGNVAHAISKPDNNGSIGVGFDPDADYGIYPKPKVVKKIKPSILHR